MLRTASNPSTITARETVLMLPPPAVRKCTELTRRRILLVSAKSRRMVLERRLTLSVSLLAMRLIAVTDSDRAGKSLLWRMRRNRNSTVACALTSPLGTSSGGSR